LGQRVAISIFFGLVAAMSIGGTWSGFGLEHKDAVLAISFVAIAVVSFVVHLVRHRDAS
jgi:hypothetical protein